MMASGPLLAANSGELRRLMLAVLQLHIWSLTLFRVCASLDRTVRQ